MCDNSGQLVDVKASNRVPPCADMRRSVGRPEAVAVTGILGRLRGWARSIKRDVIALYLASRDPRVPWHAKAMAVCVVAYALSPIDLIPDFIPVLGYLDELVVLPLGILLAVRLVPADLMVEFREEANRWGERPTSRAGAAVIVVLWLLAAGLLLWMFWPQRLMAQAPCVAVPGAAG